MTKIQILIYTDYKHINEKPALYSWGITELKKFILDKTAKIAEFEVHYQNRFASKDPQKLTADFLSPYHQVWVLAFNTSTFTPFRLDDEEVQALQDWMDRPNGYGGGLLVAGDHAEGQCAKGDPKMFSAHGRSLGEPMKRAGQLRVWQGPPTACVKKPLKDSDNFNTCEGTNPSTLDQMGAQTDQLGARLLDMPSPHSLLFWKRDSTGNVLSINRFPDHQHESKLQIPAALDGEWPQHSPFPVVAAKARDRRFPQEERDYPLVVAYDGDPVDVGRLVADSSFHHYLNINLFGLPKRDATGYPEPDSDLDQIAQFYGNLAFWLTPKAIRKEIKSDIFFRLATDPDVFEVRGTGEENLGSAGQYASDLRIGTDNLHRIVSFTKPDPGEELFDRVLAGIFPKSAEDTNLCERERTALLGSIIETYHAYLVEKEAPNADWLDEKPDPHVMLKAGIALAERNVLTLAERLQSL